MSEVTSKPPYRLSISRMDGYEALIVEEDANLRVFVRTRNNSWTGLANDIDGALNLVSTIIAKHPFPVFNLPEPTP